MPIALRVSTFGWMKLSLVIPVHARHENHLFDFQSNSSAFFKKLPLELEILIVADKASPSQRENWSLKLKDSPISLHFNDSHLGRGPSVERALRLATGDLVLITTIDSGIPLAEVVSVLQSVLQTDQQWDVLIGNRFSSKKKLQGERRKWHRVLEDIILEKNRSKYPEITDCLSPFVAINKHFLLRLQSAPDFRLRNWYYSMKILEEAKKMQAKISEIPIQARINPSSLIPLFKEYFTHIF